MTSRAFSRGLVPGGGSSYDALVAAVPDGAAAVLDVACGDGYLLARMAERCPGAALFGIDMSEAELAEARRRPALSGATLARERAQRLSLGDSAVDAVLSHLALMLMDDIDAVVAELARVLKPDGTLVFVVGGGQKIETGAWPLFGRVFRQGLQDEAATPIELGDPRVRSGNGIRDLLAADFDAIDVAPLPVTIDAPIDAVWDTLATTYGMPCLSDAGRERVEREFRRLAAEITHADGTIPFTLPLLRARCRRA